MSTLLPVNEIEMQQVLSNLVAQGIISSVEASDENTQNTLYKFLNIQRYFLNLGTDIQAQSTSSTIPTFVASGDTYTIPENTQAFYKLPIHVHGDVHIRGDLIQI